mmetsp:Transcript_2598/g.6644  ORF Transcript_2598/g.6644 Transcript_2598/m.6644 type:complete len:216 (+) Transcript_2598:252-899(+)
MALSAANGSNTGTAAAAGAAAAGAAGAAAGTAGTAAARSPSRSKGSLAAGAGAAAAAAGAAAGRSGDSDSMSAGGPAGFLGCAAGTATSSFTSSFRHLAAFSRTCCCAWLTCARTGCGSDWNMMAISPHACVMPCSSTASSTHSVRSTTCHWGEDRRPSMSSAILRPSMLLAVSTNLRRSCGSGAARMPAAAHTSSTSCSSVPITLLGTVDAGVW